MRTRTDRREEAKKAYRENSLGMSWVDFWRAKQRHVTVKIRPVQATGKSYRKEPS